MQRDGAAMTPEESVEAAYKLLRDNGFTNIIIRGEGHFWLVKTEKGVSASSDEPDTFWMPHECAQALVDAHKGVAPAPEPEQSADHETHSETVPEAEALVSAISDSDVGFGLASAGDAGITEGGESDRLPPLERADMDGARDSVADEPAEELDVQEPVREEVGSPAEAPPSPVDLGDADAAPGDAESAEGWPAGGGGDLLADDGSLGEGDSDVILDADYADIPEDAGDLLALEDQSAPAAIEGGDIDPLLIEALDETPDLGAEILETDQPNYSDQMRFYGLDDLDRRRSLRIGDVSRYAIAIRAPWTSVDDARLVELRNFVMGVSEGRWPDDEALRGELTALEAMLGRNNAIDAALQAKVTFLNGATREDVEAFVVEEGWP